MGELTACHSDPIIPLDRGESLPADAVRPLPWRKAGVHAPMAPRSFPIPVERCQQSEGQRSPPDYRSPHAAVNIFHAGDHRNRSGPAPLDMCPAHSGDRISRGLGCASIQTPPRTGPVSGTSSCCTMGTPDAACWSSCDFTAAVISFRIKLHTGWESQQDT